MRKSLTLLVVLLTLSFVAHSQERLPQQIAGTWRIARILSVRGSACWTEKDAQPLVGSLLQYTPREMRWRGGSVPLTGITTRSVTSEDLAEDAPGSSALKLSDLGIHSRGALEVNMQHEDADITGSSTEVPGDSVLVVSSSRIVVSACGVYLEARRLSPHLGTPETKRKGF